MIEVIFLVIVLVIVLFIIIKTNYSNVEQIIFEKEQILGIKEDKLKIAQKKYMQGKIKKEVYDGLSNDLQIDMVLTQLDIFRIKKIHTLEIEEKAQKLFAKLANPTKHRQTKLRHLLIESEVIRKELKFIENKLLKNEITENVFQDLIKLKEKEMIEKESEIINFIKGSS